MPTSRLATLASGASNMKSSSYDPVPHDSDLEQRADDDVTSVSSSLPYSSEHDSTSAPTIPKERFNLRAEVRHLLSIAIPTIAVQFSIYFLYPQTASVLGRTLGTQELAGFSLASLTGNITCLSVIMGVLSASDTLQPRAFGTGDYREVGSLSIRGVAACVFVLIPLVIPLLLYTEDILNYLGQDDYASTLAQSWVRVYLLGVPSVIIFRVVQRFLACQSIVLPMVYAAAIGCFIVQPILLKVFVPTLDFIGSGIAVVTTQTLQATMILSYLHLAKPHDPQTWPGLSCQFVMESLHPRRLAAYLRLSLGGVLSFSEWWYWEIICFTAGKFGIVAFCAHTIAYQLIPTLFMIPLGTSVGLSVRIGNVLAHDVDRAKRIAAWTMGFATLLAALQSLLVHFLQDWIIRLFTTDEDVIEACDEIWPMVSMYVFILNIFGINSGIIRALGLQLRMALVIFVVLWCCTLPTVYYLAVRRGGELAAMWTINCIAYSTMNVVLIALYVTADWNKISKGIRRKTKNSIVEGEVPDEETYLLTENTKQMRAADLYE
mmetsp:Transcript_36266/g.79339  ORF Transcript_36266/g.79339 Transcript_36266/m.79339 type:complete len:546 (+) Transcript_36266:79-1716(+)